MIAFRFPALLALAAVASTTPAAASHGVANAPSATAAGNSSSGGQAYFDLRDGSPYFPSFQGGTSTLQIDVLTPTHVSAAVTSSGTVFGEPFGGGAMAGANLATGILKARVDGFGPNVFGFHLGLASASLADTIYFTNNSGGDLAFTFRYRFDGSIFDSNGSAAPTAKATLRFSCFAATCYNDSSQGIRFAGDGSVATDTITAYMDEMGLSNFARNDFGGAAGLLDKFDVWQAAAYGSGGIIDGWMQASLLIPTGQTSLGVFGNLELVCGGGSNCNFGNTGAFSVVGGLPSGLSFTSASGVFLTQGTGAVPEPASWAMLIAGFGLVGALQRRRLATVSA